MPTTQPAAGRFTDLASLIRSGAHVLRLGEGQYQLGPGTLEIPADFQLIGAGPATVVHAMPGTKVALRLRSGTRLSRIRFDGHEVAAGSVADFFISVPPDTKNVTLDNLEILDCPRAAIGLDHASDVVIRNCRFERIALAVSIEFSHSVRIQDNAVVDATIHGIQFWGNWKWQQQAADNLLFSGNTVVNGGNCCIWGSGARHVIMANNFVDGAKDVGLDLEWCSDSVISANVARRCHNAGIALFFACKNVAITGNSVANDAPISDEDAKADWWARSGIWLTYPNRKRFRIRSWSRECHHRRQHHRLRLRVSAGRSGWRPEARNVVIANNAIAGGQVWSGGRDRERPMRLTPEPNNVVLGAEAAPANSTTQASPTPLSGPRN